MILSLCPAYFSFHIAWEFVEEENRTLYTLLVSDEQMERITIAGNFVMQVICFVGIAGSNFMLVYALQQKTKWRQNNAHGPSAIPTQSATSGQKSCGKSGNSQTKGSDSAGGQSRLTVESNSAVAKSSGATVRGGAAEHAVNRDRKLGRMIVLLSGILFLCYIPSTIALLVQLIEPGFSMLGRFNNSFFATWSFVWVLDAFNSSVNIFVYYNMSSKYRSSFNKMFSRCMRKGRVKPKETNGENSTCTHRNLPDKAAKAEETEKNNENFASITSPNTLKSSLASET
ncbi:chemosensory receptor A [Elysia marginata]|uniref:Chemosensory receptor A n=1 Tax=Elysia marginata TaxID=1093978 RepID=A0AAV4F0P8_9GAST|nr:chemosensory receptor A [Elysia marginata]